MPTASDLVDGAVSVTADHTSGATFAVGTTTVTFTATDAHGNQATRAFHVTVVDTTRPVISGAGGHHRRGDQRCRRGGELRCNDE